VKEAVEEFKREYHRDVKDVRRKKTKGYSQGKSYLGDLQ